MWKELSLSLTQKVIVKTSIHIAGLAQDRLHLLSPCPALLSSPSSNNQALSVDLLG